ERVPYALTITRLEEGEPDPEKPWEPAPTVEVDYPCRGWLDEYETELIDNSLILATDARVFIIASSLEITPETTDTLTVRGQEYSIIHIKRDPGGARWELQVRACALSGGHGPAVG